MIAKKRPSEFDLFRSRLEQMLSHDHPIYKLAKQIDWSVFEAEFGPTYCEGIGRPDKPIRLLVGIHYLKYAFNESDESVVGKWVENPYWQYFCGYHYFQHEFPLEPTTLVKWRQRVGAEKLEILMQETLNTARRQNLLTRNHLDRVNVDTTVQEKNIAFPTDGRLYHKARERLVKEAAKCGIELRQSYKRKSKSALIMQSRYAHAKQIRRARKMTKQLKTYLGRVVRDIERQVAAGDVKLNELLSLARRLLEQDRYSKGKLYSIHSPEVECISKGKAHKRYEFGCKVGFVTTSIGNWLVGAQAFHGNHYDGHTLNASLEQLNRQGWFTIRGIKEASKSVPVKPTYWPSKMKMVLYGVVSMAYTGSYSRNLSPELPDPTKGAQYTHQNKECGEQFVIMFSRNDLNNFQR